MCDMVQNIQVCLGLLLPLSLREEEDIFMHWKAAEEHQLVSRRPSGYKYLHSTWWAMLCDSSISSITSNFIVQIADSSCRILSLGNQESQCYIGGHLSFFYLHGYIKSSSFISEYLTLVWLQSQRTFTFQITYCGPVVLLMMILIFMSINKAWFHKVCHCFCASLEHELL